MSEAITDPISIDVVIPVWNDEAALSRTLPRLLQEWSPSQIRVVDGGSSDGSTEIARRYGVRLTNLPTPSRARQLNAGAAASTADAVLFLHADTTLPPGARDLVASAIARRAIGGAFSRRFDTPSLFLRFTCLTADWRGQLFGRFFGDQAIFATNEGFKKTGGFPDQPLFEDFEFTRRLSALGRLMLLKPSVISSARRFERRGPVRQTLADFILTLRYLRRGPAIFSNSDGRQDAVPPIHVRPNKPS